MRRLHLASIIGCCFGFACSPAARAGTPLGSRAVTEEVFYQFMPIAWRDSTNDAHRFGDFDGMTASLDYLENLGVTAVWMTPIFPSAAYHGYQHGPGDQLNTRFGTEPQFLNFVQQAHARGIKVFIDFVVYGISQNSTWYTGAYNNPGSPYDTWLAFTNAANTSYLGSVYNTWNGASVGFIHWDLNNANPRQLDIDWAKHWLDPNNDGDPSDGIDGFRLDHVWEDYNSGPNGWGYNIDSFWKPWKAALKTVNPDVFTFAEQADWGITGVQLMPAFDSTFTKPWEFAVRDSLANETSTSVYSQTAATLAQQPPGRHFLGTIGDHDVDRLTSVIGGSLTKAKAAAAMLMASPFPPIIYFGDEIGMRGTKGNFGSDANDIPMREPFKWNAVAGPPMSNYWILNSQAYNSRFALDNDGRSVQEQNGVSGSLLEAYKQLIALRKSHVALRRGTYYPVPNSTNRVWSFVRHQPGEETLLVVIRLRNTAAASNANLSGFTVPGGSSTPTDLLTGATLPAITTANKAAYSISMGVYDYKVLSVNLLPIPPTPNAIDGVDIPATLGPFSAVATQDTPTALGDNVSELDQLFVRPQATGLKIGISGNMAADSTGLVLLVDSVAGGQNILNFTGFTPPPGGPDQLTGLKLDAGFAPDHMLFVNTVSGTIYVDQFVLPTASAATKTYRGQGVMGSGSGVLSGGINPNNMQVAMSNTNILGVTDGNASGAATARDGFDLFVPYSDIGSAGLGGNVKVAAFILRSTGKVSNQWLPGIGGGLANLGTAPDMTAAPGHQFVTVNLLLPGDINGDNAVNANDAANLVAVLLGLDTAPAHVSASDLNRDGMADGADVQFFISAL